MKQLYITAAIIILGAPLCMRTAEAFKSTGQKQSLSASGTIWPENWVDIEVVSQGTSPDQSDVLGFSDDGDPRLQAVRDSNESIRVEFSSNAAIARLIISTDNQIATRYPELNNPCRDEPIRGNDGAGLAGVSTMNFPTRCKLTVPMLWVVYGSNIDHDFSSGPVDSQGKPILGDNEVFITDKAHVRSFLSPAEKNGALDNLPTKFCDPAASDAIAPTNNRDDQLYPQYFGAGSVSLNICNGSAAPVVIDGRTYTPCDWANPDSCKVCELATNEPCGAIIKAMELSEMFAVVAYNVFLDGAQIPVLSTQDPTDNILVSSPIYIPIAADFRGALTDVTYRYSNLSVELVIQ